MSIIHLQGIGIVNAKPVSELKPGQFVMFNYGSTAEILSVIPSKTGKSAKITMLNHTDNKQYVRSKGMNTLMAIASKPSKGW